MYSGQQILVYILTFFGYAAIHALRQGWSYSKSNFKVQLSISTDLLGIVDALFLLFYSLGMIALGSLMHKVKLTTYVGFGLMISSFAYALWPVIFGLTGFYNDVFMIIFHCINGFFQATAWPGLVGLFSKYFEKNKKGLLLGIWSINANIGNLIAQGFLNIMKNNNVNWVWNFVLTGGMCALVGLLIFVFLNDAPKKKQKDEQMQKSLLQEPNQINNSITQVGQKKQEEEQPLKYGIFSILCLPRVPLYIISYACMKGCTYGLLFWLPSLLTNKGGDIADQNGYICSMFDIGAIIGGGVAGFLADFFNRRAIFLGPSLFICSFALVIVSYALTNILWTFYLMIFLVGFFISGPYNLIGTLITIDIGNSIKSKSSVTKVSSLVQGCGAFFTAIQMIIITHIPQQNIFYLFSSECFLATLALIPMFLQQFRQVKNKKDQQVKQ